MAAATDGREEALRAAGAAGDVLAELLRYDTPILPEGRPAPAAAYADEPHVGVWEIYAEEASRSGAVAALAARFPQMRFPVEAGVSATEAYRAATRRGEPPPADGAGPVFVRPAAITLALHETLAGRLPILVAEERADFETLVRVFAARGEPEPVPASMGACLVKGFNNWDRIGAYRRLWEEEHPGGSWANEGFPKLVPQRALYEDRFMILSSGPYSGLPASEAGLGEDEWRRLSLAIRRDHECTHYFTLRAAGTMRTNLLDEVIADYVGLVATFGRFREDLALRFFGVERYPAYRTGARLENYRGSPPVSDAALEVLKTLVHGAIGRLALLDASLPDEARSGQGLARVVLALLAFSLAEIAAPAFGHRVTEVLASRSERLAARATAEDALDLANRTFADLAARHAIPERAASDVRVVLDELLSNVRRHASGLGRPVDVEVGFAVEPGRLVIEVSDDGAAFDPLGLARPATDSGLAARPIGGLGVLFVRTLTDEQAWERTGERNRLRLVKRF